MSKTEEKFNPDYEFMKLCEKGDLVNIKKLLTVYTETDIFVGKNHGLTVAAKNNKLEVVNYLLEKTLIGKEANVYEEQGAYLVACYNGHTKIIERFFQHWLDNKEFQQLHPQIWEWGFSTSYVNEKENGIKLFIESPIMKPFANIHMEEDNCFITLFQLERKDLLETLIIDLNIEKTPAITDYLNNSDNTKNKFGHQYKIDKKELIELFEKRDFHNKLNNDLPEKMIKKKNKKI